MLMLLVVGKIEFNVIVLCSKDVAFTPKFIGLVGFALPILIFTLNGLVPQILIQNLVTILQKL